MHLRCAHFTLLRLVSLIKFPLLGFLMVIGNTAFAQDSSRSEKAIALTNKFLSILDRKTSSVEQKLDRQTDKYLDKLQKQENRLRRNLYKKDSTLAKQLFNGVNENYAQIKNTSGNVNKYQNVYCGHLDSLSTALHFLSDQNDANNPELKKLLLITASCNKSSTLPIK